MSRDRESWEVMAREEGNGDTTVGRRLCALWLHWPPTPRMEGGVTILPPPLADCTRITRNRKGVPCGSQP
jgi:hypothetical protein